MLSATYARFVRALFAAGLAGPVFAAGAAAAQAPSAFSETCGSWRVACAVVPASEEAGAEALPERRCALEQSLSWRDGQIGETSPLATVTLAPPDSEGQSDAVFVVPFGLLLSGGMGIGVDGGEALGRIPFHICLNSGCVLRGGLDGDVLSLFEQGRILALELVSTSGRPFVVEMALDGFTAALARLREVAPPPDTPAMTLSSSWGRSGEGGKRHDRR